MLKPTLEEQLVRHLLLLDSKGFGLTVSDVRELTFQFAVKSGLSHKFNLESKMAEYDWVYSFLDINPNLSVRKAQGLSYARSKGVNKDEVRTFLGT
jgi:hypothetical protein